MLSLPPPVNEERSSPVGLAQRLPPFGVVANRGRGSVQTGKHDRETAAPGFLEFSGSAPPVVALGPHAASHRQVGILEKGRDRSRDRSKVRTPLADVVQQRCFNRLLVSWEPRCHPLGDVQGVALVGEALPPEQVCTRWRQAFVDVRLFFGAERSRAHVAEESQNEVAGCLEPTGHEAALHLTQRRAAGRYSMRSGSISSPHVSQTP